MNELLSVGFGAHPVLKNRCGAPAPLVVNGGFYAGCELDPHGVEVDHKITITWAGVRPQSHDLEAAPDTSWVETVEVKEAGKHG